MKPEETPGYPKSETNGAADDHRRPYILRRLAEHFPQGVTPERIAMYIADFQRHGFLMKDVREACERVIARRDHRSFPTFATLLIACHEVRGDRVKAEQGSYTAHDSYKLRDVSPHGKDADCDEFRKLREKYGPDRDRNPAKSELTIVADTLNDVVPF